MANPVRNYTYNPPPIIVDDSDPAIQYNGAWHAANETEILMTDFSDTGTMPILNTLHVLKVFNGSFSYNFTGSGIFVFANPVDTTSYTSQCFVDGTEVPFNANNDPARFGQTLPVCQAFGLPDNTIHTISLTVSVPPRTTELPVLPLSGFSLDYMLIDPPSGSTPWDNGSHDVYLTVVETSGISQTDQLSPNALIFLGDTTRQIGSLSRDWILADPMGFQTTTPGTQFNLTFTGTRLWWYGYLLPNNTGGATASSATFSIDGGTPTEFSSLHAPPTAGQEFLFSTPVLPYANHSLTVVHHGNNETYPLTLQSFLIQKSIPTAPNSTPTVPSPTMGLSPSTTPTPSKPPESPHLTSKHGKLGVIVGGIAAGVVFLVLMASGLYILGQRARRRQNSTKRHADRTTAVAEPFPISNQQTIAILAPEKTQPGRQNIGNPFMQQELPDPPLTKWTRRHTIGNRSAPVLRSFTARVQQHALPGSRLSHPVIQAGSQFQPINTDTMNAQHSSQIGHSLGPTASNIVSSPMLPAAQGARQEDSGLRMTSLPDLPPLYTTY